MYFLRLSKIAYFLSRFCMVVFMCYRGSLFFKFATSLRSFKQISLFLKRGVFKLSWCYYYISYHITILTPITVIVISIIVVLIQVSPVTERAHFPLLYTFYKTDCEYQHIYLIFGGFFVVWKCSVVYYKMSERLEMQRLFVTFRFDFSETKAVRKKYSSFMFKGLKKIFLCGAFSKVKEAL